VSSVLIEYGLRSLVREWLLQKKKDREAKSKKKNQQTDTNDALKPHQEDPKLEDADACPALRYPTISLTSDPVYSKQRDNGDNYEQ
jgi:hypothetical protein